MAEPGSGRLSVATGWRGFELSANITDFLVNNSGCLNAVWFFCVSVCSGAGGEAAWERAG